MIPKIVFTYWEGDQLSELHYYTIYSLHKHNPDLDIIIYTSTNPTNILVQWNTPEHTVKIQKTIKLDDIVSINRDKIKLVAIDFKASYNVENEISCIYKADFTRIVKLYEHGGVWFDMDILFTKPLPEYLFANNANMLIFRYNDKNRDVIPTGFIAGVPRTSMLTQLYYTVMDIAQSKQIVNYQAIGPFLWEAVYRVADKRGIVTLQTECIYPFVWNRIDALFRPTSKAIIPECTFGIHWFNGGVSTKDFINRFDKTNINPERSLFEALIHEL
jgi:hypothetical protein